MICTRCHQNKSEDNFYIIKGKYKPICRECKSKESSKRWYDAKIDKYYEDEFDHINGGVVVRILNKPKANEKKYNIIPTNGEVISTDDKNVLLDYFGNEEKKELLDLVKHIHSWTDNFVGSPVIQYVRDITTKWLEKK